MADIYRVRDVSRYFGSAVCRACGRPLSNPLSIQRGYGPWCYTMHKGGYSDGWIRQRVFRRLSLKKKLEFLQNLKDAGFLSESQASKNATPSRWQKVKNFLIGAGKSIVAGAITTVLTTSFPPLGAVAIPAYHLYNYGSVAFGLSKAFNDWRTHRTTSKQFAGENSNIVTSNAAGPLSDKLAEDFVTSPETQQAIKQFSKTTHIGDKVYSKFLEDTLSSRFSEAVGQFANFAIGKV